jgi:cytochrome c oxidase cbb3-type subunit 3
MRWTASVLYFTATTTMSAMLAVGQAPVTPARAQARPQSTAGAARPLPQHAAFSPDDVKRGSGLFLQNCAFCHGKDAGGGESGPDLTRSNLVTNDKDGEAIGALIHSGRLEKGMPRFDLNAADTKALVAFIHSQQDLAMSQTGARKGVEVADLQTGNVAAGQAFFTGAGGCSKCHSPEGDLKGIATKFSGLRLEQQMLMPRDAKAAKVTLTTSAGKTLSGPLLYQDEFTIALTDEAGMYHSFLTNSVRFKVENPVNAHVELLGKYTDDDIHNLMAFIQTLK